MASLFRVKVIESNQKYEQVLHSTEIEMEHNYHHELKVEPKEIVEEYLNESLEDKTTFQITSSSVKNENFTKNVSKSPIVTPKTEIIKRNSTSYLPPMVVTQKPKHLCYICGENASSRNILMPFVDTISRVITIEEVNDSLFLCDSCTQKLKDAQTFFNHLNQTVGREFSNTCCQFCFSSEDGLVSTSNGTFGIINSLPVTDHEFEIHYKGKTCLKCVQLLSRIKMIRKNYMMNLKNSMKIVTKPKKLMTSNVKSITPETFETFLYRENQQKPDFTTEISEAPYKNKKKPSKYVKPNPNEPLPDGFQCHLSDFEDVTDDFDTNSDLESNECLNVPFTTTYHDCSECLYKFVNPHELQAHFDCMHRTFSTTCDICKKTFKEIASTKYHKLFVHFSEFSAFASNKRLCEYCGLMKCAIEEHYVKAHFGTRPFKCDKCSYKAKTKSSLENHMYAIHLGEKRHKCNYCEKRFSYAADRGRHEIGVHTKKFKYICPHCGKCFLKKNFLTSHINSQHPNNNYDECFEVDL